MTQRINITIPDQLFDRLQVVKDQFNVSGVCQEALEREVKCNELRMRIKETDEMNEVIERMKHEKAIYDARYIDNGRTAGMEDAKQMSYEELVDVLSAGVNFQETDAWDSCQADVVSDLQHDDPAFDLGSYSEGWIAGIKEFWETIKDKL